MDKATLPPARTGRVLCSLALCLAALILWPPAHRDLFVDEAINATVAQRMLAGDRLYADVVDWKGPLGYLIYAGVLKISGASYVAVHLFALVCVLLLAWCAGRIAHFAGFQLAFFPTAFLLLFYLANTIGASAEMDLFMVTFVALGVVLLIAYLLAERPRGWMAVAAGLLLLMGIATKQVAVLDTAALMVTVLALPRLGFPSSKARAAFGLLLAGMALGAVGVLLIVLRISTLGDYLAWSWILPTLGQSVSVADRVATALRLLSGPVLVTGVVWLAGIGAVVYLVRRSRAAGDEASGAERRAVVALLGMWLAAGVVGAFIGRDPLPHHCTQPAVPLAALAGIGVTAAWLSLKSPRLKAVVAGCIALAMLPGIALPARNAAWRWRDRVIGALPNGRQELGEYVAARTAADDTILVLSHDPSIIFFSERKPASRYIMMEFLWHELPGGPLGELAKGAIGPLARPLDLFMQECAQSAPAYIFVPTQKKWLREIATKGFTDELEVLLTGYVLEVERDEHQVYVREDLAEKTHRATPENPAPPE